MLAAAPPHFAGHSLTPPTRPAEFRLHDQSGRVVTLRGERGKVVLITFLYTHCPDICPLIATHLDTALRDLGPARAQVRVLAISVDPKGDTPTAVRTFISVHRLLPQFRYLTGTPSELRPVWAAYHLQIYGNFGIVSHSAYVLLVDRSGHGRALYDPQVRASAIAHDVKILSRG
jgi:protein SCO1